jgi:hypothetical protein
MIRYHCSPFDCELCQLGVGVYLLCIIPAPSPHFEKSKLVGSGGSTFARRKLKGIDGMTPQGVESAA